MTQFYLVLLETSGNQNFIFATNRLRENIGASELTYQAGTKWVIQAVATQNKEVLFPDRDKPEELRKMLRNNNPALESSNRKAEIIVAASGKALVLTKDENTAKAIIAHVTKTALQDAPGLDVSGVYEKIEDWDRPSSLADAIKAVHKTFEKARSRRPSPENRFLRLPIIDSCAVSSLPASEVDYLGEKPKVISKVSAVKCDKAEDSKQRLRSLEPRLQEQIDQLLRDESSDEEKRSWLAVVHADGNGLGQIFMNFEDYLGENQSSRNYISNYREFSIALDECTEAAFIAALDVFPDEKGCKEKNVAPIVPLILGGDDLTVVCDGRYALEFTREFLQKFETQTEKHSRIIEVAQEAFGVGRLSACAGVAIVKRHFPFSVAYELAEDLIKSAKTVKRKVTKKEDKKTPFPCSAIDFHILYDTGGVDLDDIRAQLKPEPNTELYNRPYVVSKVDTLNAAEGHEWAKLHQWQRLSDRVKDLKADKLPRSQSHAIRTALFIGRQATDAQCKLIQQRYSLSSFIEDEPGRSLFHESEGIYKTSFLDALDAMDFLENNQSEQLQKGNKEEVA